MSVKPGKPAKPGAAQLARYAEHFNRSESLRYFGVTISFPDGEICRCVVDPVLPAHRGGLGTDAVNGGVLAAIFDLALGASAALVDPTRKSATIQLSMSFMRPVVGTRFRVDAVVDRAGKRSLFTSATLYDEKDVPCARAQGVLQLGDGTWPGGDSPAVN